MRRLKKILTSRLMIVIVLIAIQVYFFVALFIFSAELLKLTPILSLFAVLLSIYIYNLPEDGEYKTVWCMMILAVPLIGIPMYLLCAGKQMPKKLYEETSRSQEKMLELLEQDHSIMAGLQLQHPNVHKMFSYALNKNKFPVYNNTEATYFSGGEELFPVMIEELKKAEKFIFMEYFIIDKGTMWDSILEVLKEKAAQGVEVKLIYDDFGCSTTLPHHYDQTLRSYGIEAYRFNRLRPALIIQMNNRDHRKIMVIDNKVGFTGGINLADEYMNTISRFGYWKDSAVMLKGEAVWSLSNMFLGMYSYLKPNDDDVDYSTYHIESGVKGNFGLFQPFSDMPGDEDDVGLSMHMNMINKARKYVYIDTPYLVLNSDMIRALSLAAETGIDVRILVPHIPDKGYVFSITRSNYAELLKAGVRIYEFTPGFNHCKNLVSDDTLAIVGTVNTDYRSYFLHFEDGVLMYRTPEILKIRDDFLQAIERSHEVTMDEVRKTNVLVRMYRAVLRLLAPLF